MFEGHMKIKSNRFKCRNLPANYEVNARVKSKPVLTMCFIAVAGLILIFQNSYFFMGVLLLFFGMYSLLFSKNQTTVEFSDDFVIFYLDDHGGECYLIYYADIESYEYQRKLFDTDIVRIKLKNQKILEFKSLDRRKITKNLEKHVAHKIEDDEE